MGTAGEERTGVLVLSAWVEAHGDNGLRVRITETAPDGAAQVTSRAAATVDDVCSLVRSWLEELLRGQPQ
jgi:hypothetical protein